MTDRLWNYDNPLQRCPELRESRAANQGLHDYALMGARRSLRSLVEQYANRPQAEKPPTRHASTLFGWSLRYSWVARVNRHDEIEQVRAQDEWRERRDQIRQTEWDMHEALIEKAQRMLEFPIRETETIMEDGVTRLTIKPIKWSGGTPAQYLDLASKLARLAAEMETDRIKVDDWRDEFKKAGVDPQEIYNELVEAAAKRMRAEND
jgi:hypothetical protein